MTTEQRNVLKEMAKQPRFSAAMVVREAKKTNHPLHDRFEWDDKVAGHKFRIEQARAMIRTVKLTIVTNDVILRPPSPYFLRDPDAVADGNRAGYMPIIQVKSNKARQTETLKDEFQRIAALLDRTVSITSYFEVDPDLMGIIEHIQQSVARVVAMVELRRTA